MSANVFGIALVALASGCASPPRGAAPPSSGPAAVLAQGGRDGAEAAPPTGLDRVPDAEPRLEPVRSGGPNKPYEILGRDFVPITHERGFSERGLASWYGRKFQGRPTSSGEPYDMYAMTAAHPTLPIPSYARVRNPANGREVVVRINDRGPFHRGRIIDLSYTAALRLDLLRGVAPVQVERITPDEIRAGTWRRGIGSEATRFAATTAPIVKPAPLAIASLPTASALAFTDTAASMGPPVTTAAVVTAVSAAPVPSAAPDPAVALATPSPGFWVQLGAFRDADGATAFQRRVGLELDWLSARLSVFGESTLFRLQAGPYASRDAARDAADSIRTALQLVPVIVERR